MMRCSSWRWSLLLGAALLAQPSCVAYDGEEIDAEAARAEDDGGEPEESEHPRAGEDDEKGTLLYWIPQPCGCCPPGCPEN